MVIISVESPTSGKPYANRLSHIDMSELEKLEAENMEVTRQLRKRNSKKQSSLTRVRESMEQRKKMKRIRTAIVAKSNSEKRARIEAARRRSKFEQRTPKSLTKHGFTQHASWYNQDRGYYRGQRTSRQKPRRRGSRRR